ncbi:hypothetical protein E2C01_016756 [Portunus trituberculatus]|uniref:Uncharacterized protein n=1 Tax=Portunus trituberculatus TaxID=210409 RepID=A0A5B7DS16_PORTR|nr:hypothetical protein [Portunus trituberculatus]
MEGGDTNEDGVHFSVPWKLLEVASSSAWESTLNSDAPWCETKSPRNKDIWMQGKHKRKEKYRYTYQRYSNDLPTTRSNPRRHQQKHQSSRKCLPDHQESSKPLLDDPLSYNRPQLHNLLGNATHHH